MIPFCAALAADPPSADIAPPVLRPVGDRAVVDWTSGELVITASARRSGSEGTSAVEELARRAVDDAVRPAALRVALSPGRTVGDLGASPEVWAGVEPRLGKWLETENRYYSSGKVEVVGSLSLVDALKAWTLEAATPRSGEPGAYTGALLDARGRGAEPCFAPQILGPGPLWDGRLWLEAAVGSAPAVWVTDAAAPAADKAGNKPLVGRVASAEGCRLTLEGELASEFAELAASSALGDGALVIVVDP